MSPHAVNSFVTDLVAMAQAMERVPHLEEQLATVDRQNNLLSDRITDLEISLEASRTYAAGLEQKVHNAEVARDDAEMRFLEADDKLINVLGFLKGQANAIGELMKAVEPPKPEPAAEPTPTVPTTVEGQSEALPTASESPQDLSQTATTVLEQVGAEANPFLEVTQAQAYPTIHPDSASSPNTGTLSTTDANVVGATSTSYVSTATPEPGPYSGKFYYDEPRFIPLEVWLAGGGSEYNYNWRPSTIGRSY